MNSVAPFWDGNETWLVLGGTGLMVAFPLAYSIILPALYLPVIVMLLALVFRGVAFEFRWIGVTSKPHWTFAFAAGSTVAAFCQGVILGGLIRRSGEVVGRVAVTGVAEIGGEQRQQRLDVSALLVPKPKPGHREPMPEIVRSQGLALVKARELASLGEVGFQAARRQTATPGAEKEGLALGRGDTSSRSRAYRRRAVRVVG
jgi:hypothetical protein